MTGMDIAAALSSLLSRIEGTARKAQFLLYDLLPARTPLFEFTGFVRRKMSPSRFVAFTKQLLSAPPLW